MKSSLVVLLLFCCFASLALIEAKTRWYQLENGYTFDHYVKEFNRLYNEEEYIMRKAIFESNLARIKQHNRGKFTWKEGVNHFTDQTTEEFKQVLGYDRHMARAIRKLPFEHRILWNEKPIDTAALLPFVDWREMNVLTAVKDQGRCGSCWSFAAAESIESYWALSTKQLADLSEQNILSCTNNPQQCGGTGGCQGATYELAYQTIINNSGIASEWTYPYTSYFGQNFQCNWNASKTQPAAKIVNYTVLPTNTYAPLMQAVATKGPIAISVDASSWAHYESGVYNGCNQTNPTLDHAVLLVGYGSDMKSGQDYYLVRNSWSPTWGDDGYIQLYRNANFTCGEDLNPSDGDGCEGGPSTVQVCGTCGILYDNAFPNVN